VVTGCYGFLGKHLVRHLLEQGDEVWGIDAETYAHRPIPWGTGGWTLDQRWRYQKADIAELDRLPDCDIVVNCAAETHVDNSIGDATPFLQSNVLGTQRLLDLIRAKASYRMPLLVQVSTDEVYGSRARGFAETSEPLAPRNPYASSKAAADLLVRAAEITHRVPARIIRMTNLYGVWQYPEKLIPKAVRYLSRGQTVPVHGDGSAIRSWLLAQDAARAIWHVATNGANGEVYHANGNTEAAVIEVVHRIAQCLGVTHAAEPGFVRPGLDHRYALADQTTRDLGWHPMGDFWTDLPGLVEMERNQAW
jgi:dTDP-glucose 4,6-dehydratase